MKDVETALAAALNEWAEKAVPGPGHRERTVRRARRRRTVNATAAGVLSVALAVGGVAAIGAATSDRTVSPSAPERSGSTAATAGRYGFWSTTAEYPYVAKGRFRGARWGLRAAAVRLAPNADVRMTIQMERVRRRLASSGYVRDYDDPLFTKYEHRSHVFQATVAIVFGAAAPRTETVEVLLRNGESIEAHVFTGYDARTTLVADYYLAFLPSDARGEVVARDGDGSIVGSDVIPPR